ncbi:hypothetical protein N9Z27_00780 [Alphaproteobacteria bacterium]|nr:hypothetical protein [Alphaproteobacteria bacterium]
MHNDRKKDDILDADFDDFDDIDDGLMDDDWDEFDDDGDLDAAPSHDTTIPAPQKKSSLPRIIAYSIILLFILGGGFFFYSQFIVPTAEQERQKAQIIASEPSEIDQETAVEYFEAEGLPPMPSTVSSSDQDQILKEELTPLPDLEDITVEDLSEEGQNPEIVLNTPEIEIDDNALDVLAGDNSYETTAPDVEVSVEEIEDSAPEGFDDVFAGIDAIDDANQSTVVVDDVVMSTPTTTLSNDDIEALQEVNQSLVEKLKDYESKIVRLESKIDAMSDKKSPTRTAPPPKKDPAKQATDKAVKKAPAVKKSTASPKAWVLRSAQPGKAVVSEKGSSDIRNIEVGQPLNGIGRIQSISMIDGRWVVLGTKGKINQ